MAVAGCFGIATCNSQKRGQPMSSSRRGFLGTIAAATATTAVLDGVATAAANPSFRTAPPGEFKFNDALFGFSPDPALYLLEPYLNADGRSAYKKRLVAILKELPGLASSLDDGGRLERIERAIGLTISFINTIGACKNEPWSND
jgi:hypothetical protein